MLPSVSCERADRFSEHLSQEGLSSWTFQSQICRPQGRVDGFGMHVEGRFHRLAQPETAICEAPMSLL